MGVFKIVGAITTGVCKRGNRTVETATKMYFVIPKLDIWQQKFNEVSVFNIVLLEEKVCEGCSTYETSVCQSSAEELL